MSDTSQHEKRIIAHMNKGHALSIEDYIVVYGGVEKIDSGTGKIAGINVGEMVISYKVNGVDKTTTIIWKDAPEDDHVDVREMTDIKGKLVSMGHYAAKKRGYSHKQVTKVTPPNQLDQLIMYVVFGLAVWYKVDPSGYLAKINPLVVSLVARIPRLGPAISWLRQYSPQILAAMYAIHGFEVLFIMLPKCTKYRVPLGATIKWCVINFIEGFPSWKRFNKETE